MSDCSNENFPYEIKELTPEENKEIGDVMEGIKYIKYKRIGPKGYLLTSQYEAAGIYNLPVKSDDIFVASFPKSGTTVTQDLVWLLKSDLDYEKAKSVSLNKRFPFIEFKMYTPPASASDPLFEALDPISIEELRQLPSPRFFKTHLPMSLLPPNALDIAKVVYVARDPRDVAVSFYHHNKLMRLMPADKDFKSYWKLFTTNKVVWTPYFDNVLEAWEKRNHPNMLFLFYEELTKDLPAVIRRVAKFLGKELTDEQFAGLHEHLKFDNFKKNKSVNLADIQNSGLLQAGNSFVRKGKSGGWRDVFDEELIKEAEKWIADNVRGTDFKFPHF